MLLTVLVAAVTTSTSPSRLYFEPQQPRQGDLAVLYLEGRAHYGHVEAFGYRFLLSPAGPDLSRAHLAVPTEQAPGPAPVVLRISNETLETSVFVAERSFDASELKISKKFTRPTSRALKARLRQEAKAIKAVWDAPATPLAWFGEAERPVEGGVTGVFGTRRIFNGKQKSVHYGLDLDGKVGDRIGALAPGTVVMASMRWASGGTIILDHGGGLFSAYFHLSKLQRQVGERVQAGERLGAVGRTGRVTGPHLHLSIVVRAEGLDSGRIRALYVDPEPLLNAHLRGVRP